VLVAKADKEIEVAELIFCSIESALKNCARRAKITSCTIVMCLFYKVDDCLRLQVHKELYLIFYKKGGTMI